MTAPSPASLTKEAGVGMALGEWGEVSTRQPALDTSLLARQSGSPGSRDRAAAPPSSPGTLALLGPRLGEACLAKPEQSAGTWPLELLAGPLVKTPEGKLWPADWPEEASLR